MRAVSGDGRVYAVEEMGTDDATTPHRAFGAWDAGTGRQLSLDGAGVRQTRAGVVAAAFSSDGQWLYSLTSEGRLLVQWVVGRAQSSDWIADTARALTGYRLVSETILEPLDPESLGETRGRAIASARAAADRGDQAARLGLIALERGGPRKSPAK